MMNFKNEKFAANTEINHILRGEFKKLYIHDKHVSGITQKFLDDSHSCDLCESKVLNR